MFFSGYTLPEILTCEMEVGDRYGKVRSPTHGSSHCVNQQDFYGKHQPEIINADVMIDGENKGPKPNLPISDFHFGISTASLNLIKRDITGTHTYL